MVDEILRMHFLNQNLCRYQWESYLFQDLLKVRHQLFTKLIRFDLELLLVCKIKGPVSSSPSQTG